MTTQGAVYIAVGDPRYFDEAVVSARSLRRAMPELPILLYTNLPRTDPAFDEVVPVEANGMEYGCKPKLLGESPFERTLFLDTDTYVVESVTELFDLLDRFDIAAAHAPWRRSIKWTRNNEDPITDVPRSFSEFNTGVIAYKKSPEISKFFDLWTEYFSKERQTIYKNKIPDQPSFCRAIFYSKVNVYVLTPEYNFRGTVPSFACDHIKVLHARASEKVLARAAQRAKSGVFPRIYRNRALIADHPRLEAIAQVRAALSRDLCRFIRNQKIRASLRKTQCRFQK